MQAVRCKKKKRKEKKRKEKKKVRLIFFLTFELHAWFACTAACKSFRVGARGFAFLRICLGLRVGAVCGLRENDVGAGPQIFFSISLMYLNSNQTKPMSRICNKKSTEMCTEIKAGDTLSGTEEVLPYCFA